MTGYNLPPGVNDSDLPGNRPGDEAWDEYWNTDRAEDIFAKLCPEDYGDDLDIYEFYGATGYKDFTKAIDEDFRVWRSGEPDA